MPRKKVPQNDYKAEVQAAQQTLFNELFDVRTELAESASTPIIQIAQALVTCGIPYRKPKDGQREVIRESRTSDGTMLVVTFHAMDKDVSLPYGADRTLLYWLIDRSIKRQSAFVPWSSYGDYMNDVGLTKGGANYAKVKDAFKRISRTVITVKRTTEQSSDFGTMPVIDASSLPGGADKINATNMGITFSPRFYSEIVSRHIPFPWKLLKAVGGKPQMHDYITFLYWRTYAAKSESIITWDQLRAQLWYDDSNKARIRQRFTEAIKALQVVWPHFRAEARTNGLLIQPLKAGKAFLEVFTN